MKTMFKVGDKVAFLNGLTGTGTVVEVRKERNYEGEKDSYNAIVSVHFDNEDFYDEFLQDEIRLI